ncbi:Beige/BEACH domain containing protein [Tritrichomonas foetus]|uniref:Beige/BEACH domain containing protein n=1 Tax=Tritrichomonas foetus TaxID=1144522 RepID=A0A1J4K3B4_9EUKA|nr:Beige/BEACH domain containing protein [Tritrichomonas foetus]|eukprot:OHT05863.1 Beige/BEACH domain containing protein [Tritrichomonas foetus]
MKLKLNSTKYLRKKMIIVNHIQCFFTEKLKFSSFFMSFEPNFIADRPVWADKFILDNCISIFSIGTDSELPLVSYDPEIPDSILSMKKEITNINLLAVLFDFYSLLKIDNSDLTTILILRKLFALSFYSMQYKENERVNLFKEVTILLNKLLLIDESELDEELRRFCASTVSYSLATFSWMLREIKIDECENEYIELIKISFKIYDLQLNPIIESHQYFTEFFLSVLLSFPYEVKSEFDNLFNEALLKSLESLPNFTSQTFNFGFTIIHLIKFLESDYSIDTQINTLKLVSIILSKYPHFSEFLFNDQNIEIVSRFVFSAISQANIQIDKEEINKPKDFGFIPNQQLTSDDILNYAPSQDQFPYEFTSEMNMSQDLEQNINQNINQNVSAYPGVNLGINVDIIDDINIIDLTNRIFEAPKDLPSFSQCNYFNLLLDTVFEFCKLNEISGHPQFIRKILQMFDTSDSDEKMFSMTTFLLMWGRNYILTKAPSAADSLAKVGYFDRMLELSFNTLRCSEYIDFLCKLYPYILSSTTDNLFFMVSLFTRHEMIFTQFICEEQLNECLMKCCQIAPLRISKLFSPIFYDQRLSNLVTHLQNAQTQLGKVIKEKNETLMEINENNSNLNMPIEDFDIIQNHLTKIRKMLFDYILILLSFNEINYLLCFSSMFVYSSLMLFFESSTSKFAFNFISNCLRRLTFRDRSLTIIFNFFQKIFKEVQTDNRLTNISTQALQIVSTSFESNTESIAFIFLHTSFFPSLVEYVSFIKSEENMYLLLDLAQKCTALKGDIADYVAEMDLFSKLYPLTLSMFMKNNHSDDDTSADENAVIEIPDEFLSHLWSIVFNEKALPSENNKHPIINAAPLTLIYRLFKLNNSKFLPFITYLQDICEVDLQSALEINNSDFPSVLISTIEEYHEMTDRDSKFDAILNLFSSLAAHSLRSRDALSFFHNFSTLKGNFRPFFTVDLLRTLLFLFQSPYDSPYSFYHIDKSSGIIYLPPVQIQHELKAFTFFIEIELTEKPEHFGVLFSIESNGFCFSLYFRESKIFFDFGFLNNSTTTGSFEYVFPSKTWTNIAVTYSERNLRLFVHGKEQSHIKVAKFVIPPGWTQSYVSRNVSCNIGYFGFLKTALQPTLIKTLALLPKTAVTSFSPADMNDFSYDMMPLFHGEIYTNSLYLYNSAISFIKKKTSVNLAYVPISHEQMKVEGQIFGYSPRAKDMLRSIGGASAFLPIFAQIDQPLMPKPGEEISYEFDPTFLPFLIQVLIAYLRNSPSNQEDFATMNGFMVIGYLLSRSKLQNITQQVIEMMKRLYKEIIVPRLAYQMLEYIFLDIRLWIYLPSELQLMVYNTILELFVTSTSDKQRWFTWALPFNKILYIMRTFFWSKFTDDRICLCQQPKKNKVTKEIEGTRPENIVPIRDMFWKIAQSIFGMSFNQISANTICFLSFDQSDQQFSVETLSFLLYLLRIRNPIMLTTLISQNYTFETFFSLLASSSELIRSQCIHIFILIQYLEPVYRDALMKPYDENEWVVGIMSTMNTKGITTILADVVFGYMFGLFDVRQNVVMPKVRISQLQNVTSGFNFAKLSLFPLSMMIIADFPDAICSKYLYALDRSISQIVPHFVTMPDWDLPFIMLLIHRIPTENTKFDQSSFICLHTLCSLYGLSLNQCTNLINLPHFIESSSSRIGRDFSHILRHIYNYFFDMYLLKQPINAPIDTIYLVMQTVFEFLFIINSNSTYYLPPLHNPGEFDGDLGETEADFHVSFQELHRNRWNAAVPNIQLIYSTRTLENGVWIDSELAQRLLRAFIIYNGVFTLKLKSAQIQPLFMYSFILSAGLQQHFAAFEPFLRFLTPRIPADRGINDNQYQAFINYFAGLTKVYLVTDKNHPSHFYMVEQSNAYNQVIMARLKTRIAWGPNIEEFDLNFQNTPNNYAHMILEKFAAIEVSMIKYAQKLQKEIIKSMTQLATRIEKVAFHFTCLNPTDSLKHLSVRNEQARLQLYQFAASVKTNQRRCLKVYRELWRSLSSEGGPWCPINEIPEVHWKLDKNLMTVDMRRGRLINNYNYTDHKDASILRDVGKIDDAQNLYEEHLKQVRMSKFSGKQSVISIGDDDEDDTDLHETNNKHLNDKNKGSKEDKNSEISPMISYATENIILKADANRVTMKKVVKGSIMLTRTFLVFQSYESSKKTVSIPLYSITHIFTRRYLLIDTAIEIFTLSKRAYLIDFAAGERNKILDELKKFNLPNLKFLQTCDKDILPLLEETYKKWSNGDLSNFDYLMKINLFSGRTYNDLSQYPVFPWIIADYSSTELDLNDPNTFRDLSIPIGALEDDRLQMMKRRMNEGFEYLYGSFYTSPAVVIGYLIRIEPFASLHIELQEGKFDQSTRLFNSIPKAWESIHKAPMDFRELIPEFFYMPEFLVNSNNFDLGKGSNDVELPPWASSPRDFIEKNRAALESPIVTAFLPRWIDLIFGVNSRGNEALLHDNVFAPYFFEDSITSEVLNDPAQLKFIQEYACCFGSAPRQLFDEPHRSRKHKKKPISTFSHKFMMLYDNKCPVLSIEVMPKPHSAIQIINSRFEMIKYGIYTNLNQPNSYANNMSNIPQVQTNLNANLEYPINNLSNDMKGNVKGNIEPVIPSLGMNKVQLLLNHAILDEDIISMTNTVQTINGFAITAVPWDTSITISTGVNGFPIHSKRIHTRKITAIAVSPNFYATASLDCTLILWKMIPSSPQIPFSIMSKHQSYISCVSLNEKVDLCVSVSRKGEIITQSLITGSFIKKVTIEIDGEPTFIEVFDSGLICVAFLFSEKTVIFTFDQNLVEIGRATLEGLIQCWTRIEWPDENDYLFVAMKSGSLMIYKVPTFEPEWKQEKMDFIVSRLSVAQNPLRVIIGTMCGKVIALSFQE